MVKRLPPGLVVEHDLIAGEVLMDTIPFCKCSASDGRKDSVAMKSTA